MSTETEHHDWLHMKWQALIARVDADRSHAEVVWSELVRRYSEPHRAYHNLSHIAALLRHLERHRSAVKQPETVEFAVWFHDVIYDTRQEDNERMSAEWARCAMSAMDINERYIPSVMACVAATERHEVLVPDIADLPFFLDLDLSVLGASEAMYRQYSNAIRTEYNWVPLDQYRTGRSKVLQDFLQRPSLYFTPAMTAEFEQRARINLQSELQDLTHH